MHRPRAPVYRRANRREVPRSVAQMEHAHPHARSPPPRSSGPREPKASPGTFGKVG